MANSNKIERQELFRELMTHKEIVFQICLGYSKSPWDAEDLTQEVYLKAFKKIGSLKNPQLKKDWLFRIAKNTCVDHGRKSRFRRHFPLNQEIAALDPGNPEKHLVRDESLGALKKAVSQLPLKLKETFILREYGQLSYHEIASVLGTKKGTVMSRLSRARQAVLNQMKEKINGKF
jgi:RNA polymerase sigma-70 factor (ECF subfamily)